MTFSLACKPTQVNLGILLRNGQCFRWCASPNDPNTHIGVSYHRVWQLCRTSDTRIEVKVLARFSRASGSDKDALMSLFRLNEDIYLPDLYKDWCERDVCFKNLIDRQREKLQGICIMRQQPFECLITFICSSNNNIKRISGMVEKLCVTFGESTTTSDGQVFYDFPTLDVLCKDGNETTLRQLGFGYRAKYISQSAKRLRELGGSDWLESLKHMKYTDAKTALMQLQGVGPKVADCVLLMSLEHNDAVPVDTHVLQITANNYVPKLKTHKSMMSIKVYNEIVQFYRDRFGAHAGWAQTVLFTADLGLNTAAVDMKNENDKVDMKIVQKNETVIKKEKRTKLDSTGGASVARKKRR